VGQLRVLPHLPQVTTGGVVLDRTMSAAPWAIQALGAAIVCLYYMPASFTRASIFNLRTILQRHQAASSQLALRQKLPLHRRR